MEEIKKTVGTVLRDMARIHPDRNAITYTKLPYKRTWSEFDEETDRVAKGLMALGLKKGDHLAIWATNVPEWLQTLFATARIGVVLVTVNTNYKIFELEYLLRQSDAKALVLIDGFKDSSYTDIITTLCPELKDATDGRLSSKRFPMLEQIIYAGENTPRGMLDFGRLVELGEQIGQEEFQAVQDGLDCHEIINMQYTSGTTGFPKGVMLTHFNILNNGKAVGDCMKLTPEDRLCLAVPLFHCFGLVLGVMACLTHATSMVVLPYFRPQDVLEACQDENCTALHGVPTMFIAVLEHPEFKKYSFSLRTGIMAGSPCPIAVMKQVVNDMGATEITIAYGQTEASPVCTQTTVDDSIRHRVETVGRVLPGIEAKIVDPATGEELGPGQPGEFCTRGYHIMKGYYKMPEATEEAIDKDGWLHTGDLATVDKDGYYKIVGRIKDMIIRGGENIYPKEIEEFLYTHPDVLDVQVVGLPSKDYGEEIAAFIILREGKKLTEEEVQEFVKANMARHKVPKYVRFVASFPTTASGKIQKYKLREQGIELFSLHEDAGIETA
jgi:fatty-acyl-CoA synthase